MSRTVRGAGGDPRGGPNAFRPGGDFTVGVEDELLLVDVDGVLVGDSTALIARLGPDAIGASTASPEIFSSQVEFNTPVCRDAADLADHLVRCRTGLATLGQSAIATGVHPTAGLGRFERTTSPRYDAIAAEFAGVLRTPTAAFQVHVGMPDKAALIAAYRAIRNRLPVLRALAASSPYWHGRDSGLASARAAIVRSYPRVGVPPMLRSYEEYEAALQDEMDAAEVEDYTLVCWELRPHPRFGTLEVRVMDAQPSWRHATGLVALVQGLARHAAESPPRADLPPAVLAANDFRALRYGLDTRIVDVDGRMRPLRDVAADILSDARTALAGQADDDALDEIGRYLGGEPEYQRQRRILGDGGMPALLGDLVARTSEDPRTAPLHPRAVD